MWSKRKGAAVRRAHQIHLQHECKLRFGLRQWTSALAIAKPDTIRNVPKAWATGSSLERLLSGSSCPGRIWCLLNWMQYSEGSVSSQREVPLGPSRGLATVFYSREKDHLRPCHWNRSLRPTLWHSGLKYCLQHWHPILKHRFKSQQLHFWSSSLLVQLRKEREVFQKFGPLHPCGRSR